MAKTKRKEAPATTGIKLSSIKLNADVAVVPVAKIEELPKLVKLLKVAKPAAKSVHSKSTTAPKSNRAPTAEIADQLQSAFDHFNTSLFGGTLEPCILKLERLKKYVGMFKPLQWTTDRTATVGSHHEITLDPERLRSKGDKLVLSTLVHEMMHQCVRAAQFKELGKFKGVSHCNDWCNGMRAIGLTPVIMVKGVAAPDKKTGANATHTIVKGGDFDKAADDLIAKTGFKLDWCLVPKPERKEGKAKKKAGVKVKYTCPCCETSFWGKGEIKATCQVGGEDFVQEGGE